MKKRIISTLLILCIVLAIFPETALADGEREKNVIKDSNGKLWSVDYKESASGDGWAYNATTRTLTLNNFHGVSIGTNCLQIVLIGDNTLECLEWWNWETWGDDATHSVEGSGTLTIIGSSSLFFDDEIVFNDQLVMTGGVHKGDNEALVVRSEREVTGHASTANIIVTKNMEEAYYIRIAASGNAAPSATGRFTDVPYSAWYYDAVEYVSKPVYNGYNYGLMDGTTETEFSPNANADRATIVTALCRRFNFDIEGNPYYDKVFSDVPEELGAIVYWAVSSGVVTGYGDGAFGPYDPVTREQFAVMLYRYVQSKNGWRDASVRADLSVYTDSAQISDWAVEAMSWANASGYITGATSTTLNPKGNITRAEVATILLRLM